MIIEVCKKWDVICRHLYYPSVCLKTSLKLSGGSTPIPPSFEYEVMYGI
jgi:hypothetical protein